MTDTAQPMMAAENVALDNAADAFKSFTVQAPAQPRDEQGRFASPAAEPEFEEGAAELPTADDTQDELAETEQAAEEAQPEPVEMPSSWSKEKADVWEALPDDAKAYLAERETERDRAVNSKFQEAANARKASEAQLAEANANRDKFAQAIDTVLSLVQPQQPTPYDFGYGTESYDRDAYDIAKFQYEQQATIIEQLAQQRQEIAAQQAREQQEAATARLKEIEETWFPKFVAEVPDLQDPVKSSETVNSIVRYAVENGIPQEAFSDPNAITSAEMRIAWKAMQYDREQAAKARVKANNPPPKPAAPPVKPGGVTTRQAIQSTRLSQAKARLAQEGSIEAGADIFRQLAPLR